MAGTGAPCARWPAVRVRDWLALPDTDARYVRFDLHDGPNWRYGIRDITLKPLAFAATPNAFLSSVA